MVKRILFVLVSLALLSVLIVGCSVLAEPKMSKIDATSDLEQLTDGSMYTTAKAQVPEYVRGEEDNRFTEAIVKFSAPKDIRKVVVKLRDEDTVPIDINVLAKVGESWKPLRQVRGVFKNTIEIKVSPTTTDQVKVEVQRATRTADGKSAVTVSGGKSSSAKLGASGAGEAERILREPVKMAEIEVYELASEAAAKK